MPSVAQGDRWLKETRKEGVRMKELREMIEEGLIHWMVMIVVAIFMTLLIIAVYSLKVIDVVLKALDQEISKGVEKLFHRSTPAGFFHIILGSVTVLVGVILLLGFSFYPAYCGLIIVVGLLIAIRGSSLLFTAPASQHS